MCRPPRILSKVVGTFHVPSTQDLGKSSMANGTAERACYFGRLSPQSFDQERFSTPAKFFSKGLIVVVARHTDQLKSVACS